MAFQMIPPGRNAPQQAPAGLQTLGTPNDVELSSLRAEQQKEAITDIGAMLSESKEQQLTELRLSNFNYGGDNAVSGFSILDSSFGYLQTGTSNAIVLQENDTTMVLTSELGGVNSRQFADGKKTGLLLNIRIPVADINTSSNQAGYPLWNTDDFLAAAGTAQPDIINYLRATLAVKDGFPMTMFKRVRITKDTNSLVSYDNGEDIVDHFSLSRLFRTVGRRMTKHDYHTMWPSSTMYERDDNSLMENCLLSMMPETKYGEGFVTIEQNPAAGVNGNGAPVVIDGYIEMWVTLSLFHLFQIFGNLGSDNVPMPLNVRIELSLAPLYQWLQIIAPTPSLEAMEISVTRMNGAAQVLPANDAEWQTMQTLNRVIVFGVPRQNMFRGRPEHLKNLRGQAEIGPRQRLANIYPSTTANTVGSTSPYPECHAGNVVIAKMMNVTPTFNRQDIFLIAGAVHLPQSLADSIRSGVMGGESRMSEGSTVTGLGIDHIKWSTVKDANSGLGKELENLPRTVELFNHSRFETPDFIVICFVVLTKFRTADTVQYTARPMHSYNFDPNQNGGALSVNDITAGNGAGVTTKNSVICRNRWRTAFMENTNSLAQGAVNPLAYIESVRLQWSIVNTSSEGEAIIGTKMEMFEWNSSADPYYEKPRYYLEKFLINNNWDFLPSDLSRRDFARSPFFIIQTNRSSGLPQNHKLLGVTANLTLSIVQKAIPATVGLIPMMKVGNIHAISLSPNTVVSSSRSSLDTQTGIGRIM